VLAHRKWPFLLSFGAGDPGNNRLIWKFGTPSPGQAGGLPLQCTVLGATQHPARKKGFLFFYAQRGLRHSATLTAVLRAERRVSLAKRGPAAYSRRLGFLRSSRPAEEASRTSTQRRGFFLSYATAEHERSGWGLMFDRLVMLRRVAVSGRPTKNLTWVHRQSLMELYVSRVDRWSGAECRVLLTAPEPPRLGPLEESGRGAHAGDGAVEHEPRDSDYCVRTTQGCRTRRRTTREIRKM